MCGIVGILAEGAPVSPEMLESATRSLAHRGPDDHGTIILRSEAPVPVEIGLGNRRLSILDLSPLGHQPMKDPATGNWIAYNGEIYNFRELRARMENLGDRFASHSDTEVLLKAYARFGDAFVHELRGMFAFAIWDAREGRLFLARDPMGIKPLYFYRSEKYFIFASEVRTLLGTGLVPRRLDDDGLLSYLTFGSVYDPLTLVEGVRALPAGHMLVWEKGHLQQSRYWDLPITTPDSTKHAEGAEERIAGRLDEAVRMQLVSDVPVGIFLSGGIDSSALVAILSRRGVRPSTFSIVFNEAEYSEAEHSRSVAKLFNTDHHEIKASQDDVLGILPCALRSMDQPTMDGINTYFVSQKTREAGVKVALSGLGGDEIFAGYASFRNVPRMEKFSSRWRGFPSFLQESAADIYTRVTRRTDQNRKLGTLMRDEVSVVHPYFLSRMLFTPGQTEDLLSQNHLTRANKLTEILNETLDRTKELDPVNRVSYLEARCYMLNTLLRDADFMSMAHGLEVRVPLIDHRLVEQAFAVPGSAKLNSGTPKPLLVEALGGALPQEIVHRQKRGFTLPFEHWLMQSLRQEVSGRLSKLHESLQGVLRSNSVSAVWDDFQQGRTSWTRPWALYVLNQWCAQHF
ncbi:MAG TPA: asparagine synthase (glutamine-hydrolyzing) [Terriglobales bacterium]|jgi:asparagine synthase (glutamine-hydrolysing)|nr:asparagine synthase (glutamine-hydrolyzing) [Terriglobales bacterium]